MRALRFMRYSSNILILSICVVVLISTSIAWYEHQRITKRLDQSLHERIISFATLINTELLLSLQGEVSDVQNIEYHNLKAILAELQRNNSDARFIYIVGEKNGNFIFYADSEPVGSTDESIAGDVYTDAPPELQTVFSTKKSVLARYTDTWGSWVSSFAPIIDTRTGHFLGAIGMDTSQRERTRTVVTGTVVPLLAGLFLSALLYFLFIKIRNQERITTLKGELISIAAHDIRSPLNAVEWTAEAALGKYGTDPDSAFKQIQTTCSMLLMSVNELLDVMRGEEKTQPRTQCSLNEILTAAAGNCSLFAEQRSIHIEHNIPESSVLLSEEGSLRRVFTNLISNAVKYSREHSHVYIAVERKPTQFIVTIRDEGIGIAKKDIDHVTEGYYRAQNAQQHTTTGTGLGLSYCKKTLEKLHASLSITSEVNVGTSVIVTLPLEAHT